MPAVIDGTNNSTFPGVDGVTMLEGGVAMPRMVLSTAQNTTSGTSIDFTSIPSWVKRITVMLRGVSLSGTSNPLIQLGTGGAPTTSGYTGGFAVIVNTPATTVTTSTTGFIVQEQGAASAVDSTVVLTNISGNTWMASGVFADTAAARAGYLAGSIALAGVLNIVRLTTLNGTDTFDAGSVNILYEG